MLQNNVNITFLAKSLTVLRSNNNDRWCILPWLISVSVQRNSGNQMNLTNTFRSERTTFQIKQLGNTSSQIPLAVDKKDDVSSLQKVKSKSVNTKLVTGIAIPALSYPQYRGIRS